MNKFRYANFLPRRVKERYDKTGTPRMSYPRMLMLPWGTNVPHANKPVHSVSGFIV